MGKKKSVVLLTLITIVIVVLCAMIVVPSFELPFLWNGAVSEWNPVVKTYDLGADLGGGYYTYYYPEGIISETEYKDECEALEDADKLEEYQKSYTRYKETGLYMSTDPDDGVVEETEGGKTAEHVCNVDSEGSAYRRVCKKDGSWDSEISGGCTCPTVTTNGIEWLAAAPMQTQEVTCDAGSVSSVMSRTCGRYGSWYPIQGSCDCPEEAMHGMVWPQTAPGIVASIRCVAGAVGTPSTRACSSTGTWGAVTEGACSCPADAWTNYAGTQYAFPQTEAGAVATLPCVSGEGSITRACQQYGQWSAPEGCYEPVLSSGESHTWRRRWAGQWRCSCVSRAA